VTVEGLALFANPPAGGIRSPGRAVGTVGYFGKSDCGWPVVRCPPWSLFESVWSRFFVGPKCGQINMRAISPSPILRPSTLSPSHSAIPTHVSPTRQRPRRTRRQRILRPSHHGASASTNLHGPTTHVSRVPEIISHDGFWHHPKPPLSHNPPGIHHTGSPSRPRCHSRCGESQDVCLLFLNIRVNLTSP